ncbi:putative TLC domain-containing [Hyphodiscus hymeniophilus]|uniref:TLC domain-containing n=1 Tax=Hyphodiscus hymeniophilus TaxID=353542 RepID=A0A9P6VHA3_9HELO|nr:putative TLC domain-containing [Hyphodiscus hymeniophilus]
MIDPFLSPPRLLVDAVQPLADYFGLLTLPLHLHEIAFAWASYRFIYTTVSPRASEWLFPSVYAQLPTRTAISWNVRVTSLIQSSFITAFALWVIWKDGERSEMNWVGRIWGYTGAGGAVQGFAAGYFLWDLVASIVHINVLGWGSLAHAISALLVTSVGFHPFANYYGLNFILYEISTPFLNIHWFFDKLKMTGSRLQLYNGIALLATFLGGRVLWGNYQSIRIYSDVWTAVQTPRIDPQLFASSVFAYRQIKGSGLNSSDAFVEMELPKWLLFAYLGSNTILNFLNMYWFAKMIQALRKRFQASTPAPKNEMMSSDKGIAEHVD